MIRVFDIIFSSIFIILLIPFMLPIMIVLKLTGEHYIFYLQPRIGKGGKVFKVIKYATMLRDSPNLPGGFITQEKDPRILPLGSLLRKSKINEIPQLINIFIGQMSFVGPRPLVSEHFNLYSEKIRNELLKQRPGLTGVASVIFRDEEGILNRIGGDRKLIHDSIIAPYKGELEMWYLYNRSITLYFIIIFLTICSVLLPNNNLYKKYLKNLPKMPEELRGLL